MAQVLLDTSFLISFADPTRPHHQVALSYFEHCITDKMPMYLSAVAAGEFEIGQRLEDLPLQNFRPLSYNFLHAKRAAHLFKLNRQHASSASDGTRPCIINDLKLLGQAVEENIGIILTEDQNTLAKITDRLQQQGLISVYAILLREGFTPSRLEEPAMRELNLLPSADQPPYTSRDEPTAGEF